MLQIISLKVIDMKVCIDPGHNKALDTEGDPGACNGERQESIAALSISKMLGNWFEENGHTVVYTRTGGDPNLTLQRRCEISNKAKANVFISIHLNSAESKRAQGIETLRYDNVGMTTKKIAAEVQKSLVSTLGWKDRGVKERPGLYVLKHTKASAILVETGFISNDSECEKLFDPEIQEKIAEAIYKGVMKAVSL